MSNLIIVAIPDKNDRVWKVSSEQVPHLTVLFLSETEQVANLDKIVGFVEHASSMLNRFYLQVDRRGELGEDQADVLFFKKDRYCYKAVRDFRASLLQDANIRTAYDSVPQFEGPWNPHLTLGYPTAPAKPEDADWGGFYSVEFNRIAVWTGDYEGPEFELKDFWDEYETMESIPMDVAMSSMNQVRVGAGMEALEHYGTKGMRWGVRKEHVEKAAESSPSRVGKAVRDVGRFAGDVHFEARTAPRKNEKGEDVDSVAREMVIDKGHANFRKEDLPALKSRHPNAGFKKRLLKPLSKEARAYRADAKTTYIARLEKTANEMKNASGTREYTIRERGGDLPQSKYYWEVSSRQARHAAGNDFTLLEVAMDEDGYITGLKKVPNSDSMAQTVDIGSEFVLEHFGTKGMRWGVRKEAVSGAPEGSHIRIGRSGRATTSVRTGFATATIGFLAFRSPRVRAEVESANARNDQRRADKKAAKADSKWEKKVYTTDSAIKVHNAMAEHFNERIGALNNKSEYKNLDLNAHPDNDAAKKYYKDIDALTMAGYREAVKSVHGTSPSGKKQAVLSEDGESIKIVDVNKKVKHAAEDDEVIEFLLRRDDNGLILEMNKAEQTMAQHTINLGATLVSALLNGSSVEHYGVKGMRWGVRRQGELTTQTHIDTGLVRRRTQVVAKGGASHPAHDDAVKAAVTRQKLKKSGTDALSNQELRELANRVQLENQVTLLTSSKGKRFVQQQLEEQSKQEFKKGAARAAPHVIRKVKRGAAVGAAAAALA